MNTVKRYNIADYLNTDKTGSKEEFALMGVGFNTLDETLIQKLIQKLIYQKKQVQVLLNLINLSFLSIQI